MSQKIKCCKKFKFTNTKSYQKPKCPKNEISLSKMLQKINVTPTEML